jgi:drug/metabolite transporter (DMT)-like permease
MNNVAIWFAAATIVIVFTYVALLEKIAVGRHHYTHFVLARTFYMLLLAMVVIIAWDPSVLSSRTMLGSLKDPVVLKIGFFTTIGMILYYWLLTHRDLYIVSMTWPVIMLATALVAFFPLKELINPLQWIGIAIAFAGTVMVVACQKT